MATSNDIEKVKRIHKEKNKLSRIFKDIDKDKNLLIEGLIQRAAYMRITLEDYEEDIDKNGYVELFSQSEKTDPYERERPVIRLYNTMNKNYQSIIKQLSDLLPDGDQGEEDELLEFLAGGKK